MVHKTVPCRLFFIFAREANKAVILRRGPKIWTQLILWNTETDEFEYGQWFRGKIYERRCDLSPDGTKLIYFGTKQQNHLPPFRDPYTRVDLASSYTEFTAVSKPPYYTALALWFEGGTWHGGGLFIDNNTVCLRTKWPKESAHKDHLPPPELNVVSCSFNESGDGIFRKRLEQYDWILRQTGEEHPYNAEQPKSKWLLAKPYIWQKYDPQQPNRYSLIMAFLGSQYYKSGKKDVFEFKLVDEVARREYAINTDTWVDWDQRGRLIYGRAGIVRSGAVKNDQIVESEILDLNSQKPKLFPSPEWAHTWEGSIED